MEVIISAISDFVIKYGYTLETAAAAIIFSSLFQKRKFWWIGLILSYGALLAFDITFKHFFTDKSAILQIIEYMGMVVIVGVGTFACMRVNFLSTIYCLSGAITTQHASFVIYSSIMSATHNDYGSMGGGIITFVVMLITYFSMYFFFVRHIKSQQKKFFENKIMLLIIFFLVVFTFVFKFIVDDYVDMMQDTILYLTISGYDLISCALSIYLIYGVFRANKLEDDKRILEHLVHKQEEQYRMSKASVDMINIKCHDMKQQISNIGSRMSKKEMDEILDLIKIYDTSLKTGNEILDVFLAEKSLICEKSGIVFDCIVDGKCLAFMDTSDVYSLLGNAIDNAIEAVRGLPNQAQRTISLKVTQKLNIVTVYVQNYYNGTIKLSDNLPVTTKSDKYYHGFGMRSMKMIAEKYDGYIAIDTENNVFSLTVSLKNDKKTA